MEENLTVNMNNGEEVIEIIEDTVFTTGDKVTIALCLGVGTLLAAASYAGYRKYVKPMLEKRATGTIVVTEENEDTENVENETINDQE